MRILDIPRTDRLGKVQLHIRRDKMSSYLRRRALRAYPGYMQRARGNPEGQSQERLDFADWVKDVVEAFGDPPKKWSVSRIAREGGVHRNALYDWMAAKVAPQRETVARFCKGLGLEYSEPAGLLGWIDSPSPAPRDLEGFIRRARLLADHPRTSEERRRVLEARIKAAESTLRAAKEMERTAEELLREALGEQDTADEDATDR